MQSYFLYITVFNRNFLHILCIVKSVNREFKLKHHSSITRFIRVKLTLDIGYFITMARNKIQDVYNIMSLFVFSWKSRWVVGFHVIYFFEFDSSKTHFNWIVNWIWNSFCNTFCTYIQWIISMQKILVLLYESITIKIQIKYTYYRNILAV